MPLRADAVLVAQMIPLLKYSRRFDSWIESSSVQIFLISLQYKFHFRSAPSFLII